MKEADMKQAELSVISEQTIETEVINSKLATIIWFALIALSGLAAYIGEFSEPTDEIIMPILLILIIKAQLIIDYFMDLKHVRLFWRITMSAFAIVISVIIWGVL